MDHDNQILERKITMRLQTASDVEVIGGLSDGYRVVVSNRSGLKPGMQVKPQTAQLEQYQASSER